MSYNVPNVKFNDADHSSWPRAADEHEVTRRLWAPPWRLATAIVDTAAIYGNEAGVGRAIANSGVLRDIFLTTVVELDQGYESAFRSKCLRRPWRNGHRLR